MSERDMGAILARLDDHKEQLDRIEAHVEKTNGRVNVLEMWKSKVQGIAVAAMVLVPCASAILATLVVKSLQILV